jgi:hypothetical protein
MTAVTPASAVEIGVPDDDGAAPPCLVAAPWGGRIVSLLFLASVVLFALAVLTLGPLG